MREEDAMCKCNITICLECNFDKSFMGSLDAFFTVNIVRIFLLLQEVLRSLSWALLCARSKKHIAVKYLWFEYLDEMGCNNWWLCDGVDTMFLA